MNFILYLFLNINISILGCYEAFHFQLLSFPILFIFNLHLICCEVYKNLPLFSIHRDKVDIVLLYFGIFTYFPIILINIFIDNSVFHLYVLFHWIYHYLTCPIFIETMENSPVSFTSFAFSAFGRAFTTHFLCAPFVASPNAFPIACIFKMCHISPPPARLSTEDRGS